MHKVIHQPIFNLKRVRNSEQDLFYNPFPCNRVHSENTRYTFPVAVCICSGFGFSPQNR